MGAEAAVHTMAQIFEDDGTDGNLLVDASNIQITCPEMSMYMMMMINFISVSGLLADHVRPTNRGH